MNELLAALSEPFPPEAIDWRVGATNGEKTRGIALAYIQARPVMDRLDEVVGPENWTDSYVPIQDKNGTVGFICTLSLRIGDKWVAKTDGADTSDIEAIKGGISDAFKRAAVKWGIGRYLYDLPGNWVAIEARGKSFVLKEIPELPDWALPKKGLTPKSKTAARKNKPETMTIEDACKITNSEGIAYVDIPNDKLQKMVIGINKALQQEDLGDEERAEYLKKKRAIGVILRARANKEI